MFAALSPAEGMDYRDTSHRVSISVRMLRQRPQAPGHTRAPCAAPKVTDAGALDEWNARGPTTRRIGPMYDKLVRNDVFVFRESAWN